MPKSSEPCPCTGVYRSSCRCNVEAFRRKHEILPICWSCQLEVDWSLTQDLSILDDFSNPKR